ncbi:C2H2 finger domain protein [Apiospora arundinis]
MPRRQHRCTDSDDSDASFSPDDEVFDVDDNEDNIPSAATRVKDVDFAGIDDEDFDNVGDFDAEMDVEDQIQLFDGNLHPPEYWIQAVEQFREEDYTDGEYAEGTQKLIDGIEEHWFRFCDVVKHPRSFQPISIDLLGTFFNWRLSQKTNEYGRKMRGTKKSSSLGNYWKFFLRAYEREVGEKLDLQLTRQMHQVLRALAKKHGLSNERRPNRCITTDQLEGQVKTTLDTTKKSFKLGELRIYAVLYLLLLAPAGARPASILQLRYGDFLVMLERDPEGGPHNTLIKFTLAYTKTYLGVKDANTYPLPETLWENSLFLNTHVFFLAILFRHRAFLAPSLTSPHQLKELNIHPVETELPLPIKSEMKHIFFFRRAVLTFMGYEISDNEPIPASMIAEWTKRCGELYGLEIPTIPYNLRYTAAGAWTASGDISEDLRNLAMDHANSIPLRRHYLGRDISKDIASVVRGTKPQHALVAQACSVGHSMSKRRPVDLTPEQSASISNHPLIRRLTRNLENLLRGSEEYINAKRKLRNAKQRLRKERKQQTRKAWTVGQAVEDIEHQLQGRGFAPSLEDATTTGRPQRPAQKQLITALMAPPAADLEGQYRRRDNAIDAVIAYCLVEEGCTVPRRQSALPKRGNPPKPSPSPANPVDTAMLSVFICDETNRPRRCFLCVGKACLLSPEDPLVQELIHEFFMPGDVTKHLRRKHLRKLKDDEPSVCLACDVKLDHKMHLQRHALEIHGTLS